MVYVELPEVGSEVTKGETFGVVESVKASLLFTFLGWALECLDPTAVCRPCGMVLCGPHNALHASSYCLGCWGALRPGPRAELGHRCGLPGLSSEPRAAPPTPVQAASDVYAPLSGEVLEVNSAVVDDPATVRALPFCACVFQASS